MGKRPEGVAATREGLDPAAMARIQAGMSRAEIEAVKKFYQETAAAGRGGTAALARAEYLEEILKRLE
jgi:hypothetical protein